ncbi:MAG TPA: stage II sporulation protein M [Gemmataceae bacterium]|nr:stage II sporulation protein M [Gemmataceae bacterium]
MDLASFLRQRRLDWKRLEEILQHVEGSGLSSLDDEQAVEFGRLYRRAASDLNQAQTFVSGEATERYLNDLVARAYLAIYGKTRFDLLALLRYLFWGYPAVFRRYLPHFLLATLLFFVGGVFGYLVSWYDKDTSRAYLLPGQTIRPPEDGEDAAAEYNTDQLSAFSSYLFTHNVSVTLVAFALGITFGLGTVWMMFYNGVTTGVLAAVFVEAHQLTAFATGILPHGVLEIPACLIGGASGFVLAQGFLRARPWPRREEMARQGKEAVLLLFGCLPLLAVAACLEAGVARAPDWFLNKGLKLAVAGVFGLLFLAYILLLGWRQPSSRESEA